MNVSLFIPCLVDQFFPSVGINLVKILRKVGVSVDYPAGADLLRSTGVQFRIS